MTACAEVQLPAYVRFKGIYKAGSNFQRISGSIHVGAGPFDAGTKITETIMVFLWFGDCQMPWQIGWVKESIQVSASWDPSVYITIPAGTMLVHEVKLL